MLVHALKKLSKALDILIENKITKEKIISQIKELSQFQSSWRYSV